MDNPEYSFRTYSWDLECTHAITTTCKYIVLG